jgi:inosose dehydratase
MRDTVRRVTRRDFLQVVGAAAAVPLSARAGAAPRARSGQPGASGGAMRIGCASITWGGNDDQAIDDIAALGYKGIQIRSNVLAEYGARPAALRERLARAGLEFVALSSGNVVIDPARHDEQVKLHTDHASFVKACGGRYLQVTDERPKGRPVTAADYKALGVLLTEIGRRTADLGVPLGYHNHMHSMGEAPQEVDQILAAADPKAVRLELDVAHYRMGGGDPVKAIRTYADRLLFLHLKDLQTPVPGAVSDSGPSYRFVELGRGVVDLAGCVRALHDIGFTGWSIVELDSVPDKARTPKESAAISKAYLEHLGVTV